ncbi:hypothetical protein [Phaeovulum vinaykumarii]|uniref:PD-(D/E)XK nuclease superfamily protein n=1 Tax=Phaeovulum vinaykumarii TaxID=407234 RepID=A0A1N7MEV9_9RHOB|nr:hypothetical protein [Phaeovulum vinaykumarii]SIS84644.1 hypothetical protein SAMN05421795_10739 [Phaeovulum vinaykumarii]SOC11874.1 hypothetical protein SAMN05878426_10739 [Phaeovulum vinaykumarii]
MDEIPRKSAQEVEIDRLLEEEFLCDQGFAGRFLEACGLPEPGFAVETALHEPSLGGAGFGDLLVTGRTQDTRVALLIEDKITAAAPPRQAARYAEHAARMRAEGWDRVHTILVAPAAWPGDPSATYDARLDLERLAGLLRAADPRRLTHRRAVIARALGKTTQTGVKVHDPRLHALRAAYLEFAASHCAQLGLAFTFPALRPECYDGDSWIYPITHPALPDGVVLRHRLWTTQRLPAGQVDLIARQADPATRARFVAADRNAGDLAGAELAPFSKGRGGQLSLRVPEMRQATGFDPEIGRRACAAMRVLLAWYIKGAGAADPDAGP